MLRNVVAWNLDLIAPDINVMFLHPAAYSQPAIHNTTPSPFFPPNVVEGAFSISPKAKELLRSTASVEQLTFAFCDNILCIVVSIIVVFIIRQTHS